MIPLELITGGVSFGLAFFTKMLAMKQKASHEKEVAVLQALSKRESTVQNARAFKSEGIAFTRRIIAFTVIGCAFLAPILIPVLSETVTYVQQVTTSSGFWPFIDPTDTVNWKEIPGYAHTPLVSHAAMSVLGFYFGQSAHK